jgi:hypothetical protein
MKCEARIVILIFLTTAICFGFFSPQKISAATSTNVDATIKISVCGNNVAENGEECDNTDLKGKTCQSLGLGNGTVTCDASCSLVTTACTQAAPVATTVPTSAPINTVTESTNQPNVVQPTPIPPFPTATPTPLPQPATFIANLLAPIKAFPAKLIYFGANQNGTIPQTKLRATVQLWVNQWKSFLTNTPYKKDTATKQATNAECDINNDHICNIVDLSIMLYHVQ